MDDRYKKRGLKFNNSLDSRVLRVVHNQQRQRGRRDDVVNSRRQMEALQDSPQVAGPSKILVSSVDKEAVQYQKGLERYQELLKWKEIKKKQLEKEKKKRMPAFKTGVFQPTPPKFLVSGDQKELAKTPHASLRKRVATPGASLRKVPVFHLGGTPGTSLLKMPQFHTGLTPGVSTKKQILTTRKHNKQENQGVARRTRGAHKNETTKAGRTGARGHTTCQRKLREQEDLGVQPLPLTPPLAISQRKMEKPILPSQNLPFSSFAPADFAFKFEAPQIPRTDDPLAPPHMEEASQDHTNVKKEEGELISKEDASAHQKDTSFQENYENFLEAHQNISSLQEDACTSETSEIETQPTQEKDSSLQDACTSETSEIETQPAQEKDSSLQEEDDHISETRESETPQEEKDAFSSETSESESQPAHPNNSSLQEEDACISETSESETHPSQEKKSSLEEEKDACISEIRESKIQSVTQNSSPLQNRHASNFKTSECEIEPESDTRNISESLTVKSVPEDFKHIKSSDTENNHELSCSEKEMDEDPRVNEHIESRGRNQIIVQDDCLSSSGMHTSSLEVQDGEKSKPPRASRAATPAKYLTRRSVACCFDGTVTPTVSRLRPRTPCSRNTRRSLSAHCDSPLMLYTPSKRSSAGKTPRRSMKKATKHEDLHETRATSLLPRLLEDEMTAAGSLCRDTEPVMVNATEKSLSPLPPHKTTTVVQLKNSDQKASISPLLTPENLFRREQGMWTVETSPWISAERSRNKKKNKKVSDLHGMFDDLPTDGLPIPLDLIPSDSMSIATEANVGEDTVCTNLLPLLQPSTSHNTESPVVDVWGESPAHNVLGTPKTSKLQHSPQDENVLLEEMAGVPEDIQRGGASVSILTAKDPAVPEPSATHVNILTPCENEKAENRRKSKKSRKSVMFAIAEQENMKHNRLPCTPVRTSTRVSMGLFAKVDLNVEQVISEDQDLMMFESPRSEKKTSSTRRMSSRMSLLPGMTPSPAKEVAAPMPTDLMTWDSPEPRRASRSAASSLATPLRRSRRLSKAV